MYTFNRNKEPATSLSQFMASGQQILEEDDEPYMNENPLHRPSETHKMNEDFMFDMDKGSTLISC